MTGDILPDECDFCGQVLDEEDELHPVWVGEQPDPKPTFARATAEKDRRVMGRSVRRRDDALPRDDMQVLGRPMGQVVALMDALDGSDAIQVDYKDAVQELRAVGSESPDALVETSFTAEEDHGKVGVEVRADPKVERPDPDMEVCPYCKEEFQND